LASTPGGQKFGLADRPSSVQRKNFLISEPAYSKIFFANFAIRKSRLRNVQWLNKKAQALEFRLGE